MLGHLALIDGNWVELDSTWGLFEGIPAGHIFKNFFKSRTSYSWSDKTEVSMEENPNIVLIAVDKGNSLQNSKDDTTNISTENSNNSKEEEEDDDKEPIKIFKKSNGIKLSLVSLFLILINLL